MRAGLLVACTILSYLPWVSAAPGETPVSLSKIVAYDGDTAVSVETSHTNATVIVFVSTKCPVSNAYVERLNSIYHDYSNQKVQFAFLNANQNEPVEEVVEHSKLNHLPFTVLKDRDNTVADQLNAQVTPEVFIYDKTGALRYKGAVDDARNESRVQVKGLRTALDAVLAGKPVEKAETKAFGCTIKRTRHAS